MGRRMEQHKQWMDGRSRRRLGGKRQPLPAAQGFEDMLDGFHQHRAVADQLVATAGAGMMNRPGNRINLTTLFRRQPRGDQRTAGDTRLHYQYAERQTADDWVL